MAIRALLRYLGPTSIATECRRGPDRHTPQDSLMESDSRCTPLPALTSDADGQPTTTLMSDEYEARHARNNELQVAPAVDCAAIMAVPVMHEKQH
jgi:hypothetical protein